MTGLIERLEAASEGSRELDKAIMGEIDPKRVLLMDLAAAEGFIEVERLGGAEALELRRASIKAGANTSPRFTTSLDVAMVLLPDWPVRQIQFNAPTADDRKWGVQLHGGREGGKCANGFSASYPLALCIAALRARGASWLT